jgi:hypothetical protein
MTNPVDRALGLTGPPICPECGYGPDFCACPAPEPGWDDPYASDDPGPSEPQFEEAG